MADFENLVPPHEPAEDTLTTVIGMGIDTIPLIGQAAGRLLDHAIAARAAQRRHEFDLAIVSELRRLAEDQGLDALTVADVVASDEFLATLARTQREAAETASESRRRRLALAAVGPLKRGAPARVERADFLRLVVELDELHIWLLNFFADPAGWLTAHHIRVSITGGSPMTVLTHIVPELRSRDIAIIETALTTLEQHELASVSLRTATLRVLLQPGISERGRRFLDYLGEGPSVEAKLPSGFEQSS